MGEDLPELEDDRAARLWTGERVPLTVPLAGLGERALAYLVDLSLLLLVLAAAFFVYSIKGDLEADWESLGVGGQLVAIVIFLVALCGYDVLFELFLDGQTPGKKLLRLRVVSARGTRPEPLESIVRNVLRLVDWLPFLYGVGTVTLFITGTRRLGDLLANTVVVTERSRAVDPFAAAASLAGELGPLDPAPRWSDDALLRALELLERTAELDEKVAKKQAKKLLRRLEPDLSVDEPALHLARGCLALRDLRSGVGAQIRRATEAEARLTEALGARKRSLDTALHLDEAARHAASELLRSTRRGVPAAQLESLSLRLLDAERRRRRARRSGRFFAFLAQDVPAAVWLERKQVARAAAVLASGAAMGFALCYTNEAFGRFLLGPDLAGRIEDGARWTDQIEQSSAYARMSLVIILNNVRVAWIAFVSGVLGGAMPLFALGFNGLHLGSVFGYAVRLGTHATLGKFILAHGPVEMTAICVAGAAGLCLGRAIFSPGRRTRLQALRAEAAVGVRLTFAATFMLAVIGLVEGFVSPGQFFPIWVNAGVGILMWLLFASWVVYFGRPAAERLRQELKPPDST